MKIITDEIAERSLQVIEMVEEALKHRDELSDTKVSILTRRLHKHRNVLKHYLERGIRLDKEGKMTVGGSDDSTTEI